MRATAFSVPTTSSTLAPEARATSTQVGYEAGAARSATKAARRASAAVLTSKTWVSMLLVVSPGAAAMPPVSAR